VGAQERDNEEDTQPHRPPNGGQPGSVHPQMGSHQPIALTEIVDEPDRQ
jgi:hypothetical protein